MAFDQAKADEICRELATKPISLASILRRKGMPSSTEIYEWLQAKPNFAADYARARDRQADTDADEIADIRQKVIDKVLTPEQGRVAIDSLKWSSGKRAPKRYGDRIINEHDGKLDITIRDLSKE